MDRALDHEGLQFRSFGAAHRYYQGPGVLAKLGSVCADLGKTALLIADKTVADLIYPIAQSSCINAGVSIELLVSSGEVNHSTVNDLQERIALFDLPFEMVIAAGGGKGVDTGKAIAHEIGLPLIVVPTAASNDGPCSSNFVIYSETHELLSVVHMKKNPDVVLVDTEVLIKAPKELLLSGIGDALCKLYEGEQVVAVGGKNTFGGTGTIAASYLRQACDQAIRENAEDALKASENKSITPAFENLMEALVLLSGLAFENSGLSIAHSMTRGLTRAPGSHNSLHGQHVAYGLLVQWVMERRSGAFLERQIAFYKKIGLAQRLKDLGVLRNDTGTLVEIAAGTLTAPHIKNFQVEVTQESLVRAMSYLEEREETI